jgi:hypothetical protein
VAREKIKYQNREIRNGRTETTTRANKCVRSDALPKYRRKKSRRTSFFIQLMSLTRVGQSSQRLVHEAHTRYEAPQGYLLGMMERFVGPAFNVFGAHPTRR